MVVEGGVIKDVTAEAGGRKSLSGQRRLPGLTDLHGHPEFSVFAGAPKTFISGR